MFYHIAEYFSNQLGLEFLGRFSGISIRAILAVIVALFIAIIFGAKIIDMLKRKQIGESVRNLGLEGQMEKKNTPTMGGIIIILSFIVPVLLFADLQNIYIQLMILATLWTMAIGFLDDYIKVFKKNKDGLSGKYKLMGQMLLGLVIGLTMYSHEQIVVRETVITKDASRVELRAEVDSDVRPVVKDVKTTQTTLPFVEENKFDYKEILPISGRNQVRGGWILYVFISTLVIAAVSNGANLTDGIDGLAAGTSAIVVVVLIIFAYLSGNAIYSEYLDIMFIPGSGELVIFGMAFVGALIGFLWYNGYPAQVFMGDTGSLTIGAVIAVFALLIRKELLLPILCAVFFVESLSVMIQVAYFKRTRQKFGEGRRIFLMAPLHHHYQKMGFPEMKIVIRFCIIQMICAALAIVVLKII